ncbi:MAG: archaellin/type IV pilin N-terminal domain-containing protein [Archaeoglobaceae archaeon]
MGVGIGLRRDEKGFTGLEAAIVLIAFVVVAAVFSYVMLGAGFFTTQKSKQVVDTGVKQASSSLTLDGQYIYLDASENAGGKTGSNGKVGAIFFYVTQTAGGSPVDLEKTSIAITTASGYKQVFFKPLIAEGDYVYHERNKAPPNSGELLRKSSGDSIDSIQHLRGNPSLGGQVNVSINSEWCNGTVEKITSIYLKYNDTTNKTDYYMPAVSVYINSTDDNDNFDNCTFITSKGWWYEPVVGDRDNVVEANEKYKIIIAASVTNSTISNIVWKVTSPPWEEIGDIKPNDVITIEVRPPIGAPLSITKQLPPSFTNLTYV